MAAGLQERAREAEVGIYPITPYYLTPPERLGLLFGYSSLSEAEIAEGVRRFAEVVEACFESSGDG